MYLLLIKFQLVQTDTWYMNQLTLVFIDKHKVTYVGTSLYEI